LQSEAGHEQEETAYFVLSSDEEEEEEASDREGDLVYDDTGYYSQAEVCHLNSCMALPCTPCLPWSVYPGSLAYAFTPVDSFGIVQLAWGSYACPSS
jgi:hypothetical protein